MRDALVILVLVGAVGFLSYKTGYNRAQSFYVAQIEQAEREIEDALQRSSHALSELSRDVGQGDDRDRIALQEINDAETASGDSCRVSIDGLRVPDAIAP